MKNMGLLYFDDIYDIAEFMRSIVINEHESVTFVTFYKKAAELLRQLSQYNDLKLYDIELSNPDINNYTQEYYVSLSENKEIFIEKAYDGETVIYQESDVILYDGDVNSSITKRNQGMMFEVVLGVDEKDSEDNNDLDFIISNSKNDVTEKEYPDYNITYNCGDCEECHSDSSDWINKLENCGCDTLDFALKVIELLINNNSASIM